MHVDRDAGALSDNSVGTRSVPVSAFSKMKSRGRNEAPLVGTTGSNDPAQETQGAQELRRMQIQSCRKKRLAGDLDWSL